MKQKAIVSAMLVMMFLTAFSLRNFPDTESYAVRHDLSIYFSNSDSVIKAIRNSLRKRDWKITVSYQSHRNNMEDIPDLVRDLMRFALAETDDPTEGDYIYHQYGGYEMSYSYKPDGEIYNYTVSVIPDYYTTSEQEEKVTEEINRIIRGFGFDRKTADYQKVKTIYDYIYNNVDYDRIHKKNEHYHLKTTAYAALIYGQAVCQGYSVLMYRMLREAGINSRVITGTAQYEDGEEYHAWNIAEIDGLYYNIDVTWDKQSGTDEYFLRCDENFESHIRDEQYAADEFYYKYPMSQHDYVMNY